MRSIRLIAIVLLLAALATSRGGAETDTMVERTPWPPRDKPSESAGEGEPAPTAGPARPDMASDAADTTDRLGIFPRRLGRMVRRGRNAADRLNAGARNLPAEKPVQKIVRTFDGITFDSAYDNGSLLDIKPSDTPGEFEARTFQEVGDLGGARYWFRFRIRGGAGRKITIYLDHSQNERPVVRVGGGTWRRMTETEAPNRATIALQLDEAGRETEVAFFYPLGVAETLSRVGEFVRRCDDATSEVLGATSQGRAIWYVKVTDSSSAFTEESRRRAIWVHARTHAGEVTAAHTMLGFLDQITTNTAEGVELRRRFVFHVVPTVNLDGVYLGHTRWDAEGRDPERQWEDPDRTPETAALRRKIDELMAKTHPLEVALNLHSTQGRFSDTFFYRHLPPSVSPDYASRQLHFIREVDRESRVFNNGSPQGRPLDPKIFVESYFYNRWRGKVMAMTHEGHFHRRVTDGGYITDLDYEEIGRAIARAMPGYFDSKPDASIREIIERDLRSTPEPADDPQRRDVP